MSDGMTEAYRQEKAEKESKEYSIQIKREMVDRLIGEIIQDTIELKENY